MMEVYWGTPLSLVISPDGEVKNFSTIEQAQYWLRNKWPVADDARQRAINQLETAMQCMTSVGSARRAFIAAARTAGFVRENQIVQPPSPAAA